MVIGTTFYWLLQEKPVDKRPAHFGWWQVCPATMATHFVAVFFVGNNTLTTQYNIFWDLEKFWRATHFVAVFCEGNYPSDAWGERIYHDQIDDLMLWWPNWCPDWSRWPNSISFSRTLKIFWGPHILWRSFVREIIPWPISITFSGT